MNNHISHKVKSGAKMDIVSLSFLAKSIVPVCLMMIPIMIISGTGPIRSLMTGLSIYFGFIILNSLHVI